MEGAGGREGPRAGLVRVGLGQDAIVCCGVRLGATPDTETLIVGAAGRVDDQARLACGHGVQNTCEPSPLRVDRLDELQRVLLVRSLRLEQAEGRLHLGDRTVEGRRGPSRSSAVSQSHAYDQRGPVLDRERWWRP